MREHLWSFVDGRPIDGKRKSTREVPPETDVSRAISKDLKARGARFVGPTIVYAFMQATGMVNDHLVDCHRHAACRALAESRPRERRRQASSEAKPRAWQRMLSGRRLDLIDPSPLDVEIADIAHGLARVARWNGQTRGPEIFSVAQHSLLVEAIFSRRDAGAAARRPPRRAAARRARIRDRRHDLAVQGGDRRRLQAGGETADGGDLRPLRPAARAAAGARPRRSRRPTAIAAYLEATALAGFAVAEARKFFGAPRFALKGFAGYLKPLRPAEAQQAFLGRFAELDRLAHP